MSGQTTSRRKKGLFFHVPKTGGSSIAELGVVEYKGHVRAAKLRWARPRLWRRSFTFCFVRNPWDRFVSTYAYFAGMGPGHRWYEGTNVAVAREIQAFGSFEAFCEGFSRTKLARDRHFRPQLYWITDGFGRVLMDYVGRTETLQADFDVICEKLGLPKGPLPHANPSTHRHYTNYYTPKRRKLVGDVYRRDVAVLGYSFSS